MKTIAWILFALSLVPCGFCYFVGISFCNQTNWSAPNCSSNARTRALRRSASTTSPSVKIALPVTKGTDPLPQA